MLWSHPLPRLLAQRGALCARQRAATLPLANWSEGAGMQMFPETQEARRVLDREPEPGGPGA